MNIQQDIRKIMAMSPVFSRLFEKPKCKPWDLVKGRRLHCCHGLGKHMTWCWEGMKGKTLRIPQFGTLSAEDLIDGRTEDKKR